MKGIIQLEEILMFVLGIYLFSLLDYRWYWFLILLLTPDIGMLGYLFGNKIGAAIYNIFHHKGLAIIFYIIGVYLNDQIVQVAGIILFSHSAMDRAMGYGLKYDKGFKFTHLGEIGKKNG